MTIFGHFRGSNGGCDRVENLNATGRKKEREGEKEVADVADVADVAEVAVVIVWMIIVPVMDRMVGK